MATKYKELGSCSHISACFVESVGVLLHGFCIVRFIGSCMATDLVNKMEAMTHQLANGILALMIAKIPVRLDGKGFWI